MQADFFERYAERMAYQIKDMAACEHESIQRIGAIQNFGLFLACDPETLLITAISENAGEYLSAAPAEWIGRRLDQIISLRVGQDITPATIQESLKNLANPVFLGEKKTLATACFHVGAGMILIDVEAENRLEMDTHTQHLHQLFSKLEGSTEMQDDCHAAAEALKLITHFDRVMIYRFHPNWDGEVYAEACNADLDPFLGLRYPATDIPSQARHLYFTQRYRLIADSRELPVSVICKDGLSASDIDLSNSHLRASSPIHVRYLQNMQVRGSFSVPLRVQNRLWGLVSCHTYNRAAPVSMDLRSSCELAARILSGRIAHHIERRRLTAKRDTLEFTQALFRNLTEGRTPIDAFGENQSQLLALTESSGAVIRLQGEQLLIGACPPQPVIDACFDKGRDLPGIAIWKTDSLEAELNMPTDGFAGALASPLSYGFDEGLIWFRREEVQEVRWGGQPLNKTTPGALEPRTSFATWVERIGKKSRPWTEQNDDCAQYLLFNFMKGIFAKAAALASANRELERMTRAKDEFIGTVSHELRTPLSAIIGWVDILRDLVPQSGEVLEAIDIIDRNARLQVNLINDLLDISRIISGKLRLSMHSGVKLGQLIEDVVDSLRPTADARSVHLDWDGKLNPVVTADPNRMRQIIWNLLSNAIKFSPKGGVISIQLSNGNSSYAISVKDTGIGLAQGDLLCIFERFTQVESGGRSKGGLGLGLSIVKALVELHGGSIRAESEGLGRGSTFHVDLPIFALKKDDRPMVEGSGRDPFRPAFQNLNILVAEDQKDSGTALRFLIERMQGRCKLVNDGVQALEAMESEDFDLVISDIGMPGLDGYAFIERLRQVEKSLKRQPTPAIALTAYASSKDRTKALEAGFQSHIPKPVDRNELVAVVESLNLRH